MGRFMDVALENRVESMLANADKPSERITDLKSRYWNSQIKAALSVNREMLMFYWSIGPDIVILRAESRWGSSFVTVWSEDLREAIPNAKGFSKTNLFYMIGFYRLYHPGEEFPQVDGILCKEGDARTIGLLICKTKDNVLAQYAANNINAPIEISDLSSPSLCRRTLKEHCQR